MQNTTNKITFIKSFLKEKFCHKKLTKRLIIMFVGIIFVIIPSTIMFYYIKNYPYQTIGNPNSFISIYITYNTGVAFSFGENAPAWTIYFVQFAISISVLIACLFCDKWYYVLTLTFIYTGGMFNAIQRSIPYTIISMPDQDTTNAALDYFKFNFNWGIFNFPDAFVVTGTICFSLSLILEMIVNIAKENKKPKEIK